MITLITGTPGAGKTAYAVAELAELLGGATRPVFTLGIPDLTLDHQAVPPVHQWTVPKPSEDDPSLVEAFFTFPDGSLIVIDEAQQVFRPRPSGSKVPDHVSAFERHRHSGLDFWLITQHPSLIDANVRKLVGKHIHIRSSWSGRQLFERPEAFDPASRTELNLSATRPYKLPSKAFTLYKSASVHVKQSRRVPGTVYALFGLLVVMSLVGWYTYGRFTEDKEALRLQRDKATQPAPAPAGSPSDPAKVAKPAKEAVPLGHLPDHYLPAIHSRPETAPIYDALRVPDKLPTISGCIQRLDSCRCYTQQRTLVDLTAAECQDWIKNRPFRPWGGTGNYVAIVGPRGAAAGDGAAGSR